MRTRRLLIALTLSLGLTVAFLWPLGVGLTPGAHALTLIGVDSTADTVADDEACTLREAIINANNDDQSGSTDCPAGSGADTILLPAGTYALSISGAGENGAASGDLDITDDLTIVGAGAASTIIDANGLDRVIDLPLAATVAISGVTLSNGAANFGGGLSLGSGGVVTLVNSVVSDNASTNFIGGGGGIYNAGGTLTLDRTTVRNNTTSGSNGAGIENVFGATLTVNDSTISGNIGASSSVGGGINNFQATTFLNNSTVSGNTAALGHNVNNWGDAGQTVMVVNHSTIRAITGTALSTISGGGAVTTTLNHTLIAKSGLGLACSTTGGGVVVSTGYNLATDFSCNLNHITDKPSSNPLLGPLQNNGGGTETHALLSGSLAIGAGDPGFSPPPAFDQRGPGFPRVQGGVIDIGAFESNLLPQADLSLTKSVNNVSPEVGDRVRFTLTVFNGGPNPATNVEVTDLLPAGLSYDAHLASQGVYSPATGLWDVGALSASFARLEITATINSASVLTNVAEITASDLPDPDSTPGNNIPTEDDQDSATVTGIVLEADLALSKTDTPDPVQAGTSLTYTLALSNSGPAAALGLVVTDVVPLEVSILSAGIGPEGSCQTLGRAVTCTTGLKILLVDDDDDFPDVRGFYTRALEALGQTYTVFDVPGQTANGPDAATMSAYDLVIWFSGDQCCGGGEFEESGLPAAGPTEADELALATYLRNGGKLFLSSQDYHFDQGDITTTFMVDFLGVNDIVSDVESTSPISGVLDFAGLGPYPLDYLTPGLEAFPDDITPNSNGSVAFVAAGGQNLAANTGNTVFFAFPWEAIQNAADRQASLQAIIDHLTGGFGSLAPGQSRLITIATAVDPEASGLIVNTAAAASGTPDPDPAGNFASEGTTVNPPDPPQSGATLTVNTAADADDGACSLAHCSLREAINAANATLGLQETIAFNIPGAGPHTIRPNFALPTLTDPLIIDGTTQPQGAVELDGGGSEASMNGLTLDTGDSTVRGLVIRNFDGDGVRVLSGPGNTGNAITANRIFNNTGLAIDLGGDGVTPNDAGDADSGPNNLQNFPVLQRAIPAGSSTNIEGLLNSTPETVFNLEFFANPACDPSGFGQGQTFLGAISATTDLAGTARFTGTLPAATTNGQFVTATATDPSGNTSEFSPCITAGPPNDSWVRALELTLVPGSPLQATVEQHVDQPDQSRWFKFRVQPNSQVIVTLTGLP
ncbi:MAG: choice-of-anchor Q domain-containing protein, partial [Anaerolineae bacterium]